MKKFILKLLLLIVPLLIVELTITIVKDPGEIESKKHVQIKNIIIEQKNAKLASLPAQWGDFNEVYLQERKKRNLPPFDLVTWGSSRSCEIRADLFPGISYHNCVIPGSTVLDYVALYAMYKKYNYLPKTVIINIDPWTLYTRDRKTSHGRSYFVHDVHADLHVKESLINFLGPGLKEIHSTFKAKNPHSSSMKHSLLRYAELLSPSYFQSSLKVITKESVSPTSENFIPHYFVLRKDGSYTMDNPNQEKLATIPGNSLNLAELVRGDFYCDSCAEGPHMDILVSFLNQLQKENIRIILFISPIHPTLYEALKGYEKNILEQKVKEIAKAKNITLIGSFNPYTEKLTANADFIDQYHINYESTKTIFENHRSILNKALKQ